MHLLPERSYSTLDYVHQCDALSLLRALPSGYVDCVVTSPPYWNLRDYGVDGQIGLEPTPQEFICRLMEIFSEVHRVLKPTGTVWVNLGDSYASSPKGSMDKGTSTLSGNKRNTAQKPGLFDKRNTSLPEKSLMMIPARFAIAMQDDGWILRSEIVWAKRAPMPESVTDRPTKSHEMIYLFAKQGSYFYDQEAVAEKALQPFGKAQLTGQIKQGILRHLNSSTLGTNAGVPTRNLRDVWHLSPEPTSAEHFAAFPTEIPRRCILAGCPRDGVVLDMFSGTGTVAYMARKLGRHFIGCDLNPDYVQMARKRLTQTDPYQHRPLPDGRKQLSMFAGVMA